MVEKENALVGISEASRFLGVSEPTLRLWTDEGIIPAFVTPGGHRRYAKAELQKFINFHQKMLGIRDFATKLEDTAPQHREIGLTLMQSVPGYQELDRDTQQQFARLGRGFLDAIIKHISDPPPKSQTPLEIKDIGYRFGELTGRLGMTLADSVQAFISHRSLIVSATADLIKRGEAGSHLFADTIPLVDRALDDALVSLVAAYQHNHNSHPSPG